MLGKAGHTVVWANDKDKFACMTYRHNFPHVTIVEGDIRDIDKTAIPDLTIDAKRPSVVFLENVANLIEHDGGRTFDIIHKELAGRDYYLRYLVADACEYADVPQHRTRTYLLAFSDKEKCERFRFPEKRPLTKRIRDVIDLTKKADDSFYLHPDDYGYDRMKEAIKDDRQIYRFSDYGVQSSKDGISFTLKANMGTYPNRVPVIKDEFGIRRITPMECLALQGFPPSFTFPATVPLREQYKQAGNTVCVMANNWGK